MVTSPTIHDMSAKCSFVTKITTEMKYPNIQLKRNNTQKIKIN